MSKLNSRQFIFSLMVFGMACNNSSDNSSATNDSTYLHTDSTFATSDQPSTSDSKAESSSFNKVLAHKNISFKVTADGKGSLQKLIIQPSGLSADNREITLETDPLVDAQVMDLNGDGYPELLLFTQSAGSGSYGKVIAYSVNNGKSVSSVTFPLTSDNKKISKGYMGHDKFTIENNQLVQRFPIYEGGDSNSKPSGKVRVIIYRLKDGEALRIFEVDNVKEVQQK